MKTRIDAMLPYASLQESMPALLSCLRAVVPMRIWMAGRLAGKSWTVIQADDSQRQVKAGDSFSWPDTLCVRMLEHYGCCFAEDAAANPILADAPARNAMPIGAYIGYPILSWRGELLGTICGVDPKPQAPFTGQQRTLVETISRTISTLVAHSFKLDESRHAQSRETAPASIDHLTGLLNQNGWQVAMDEEERALEKEGADALVVMVELREPEHKDGAADSLEWDNTLNRIAQLLKSHVRKRDAVAKVGPNRYALLLRGLSSEQGQGAAAKIRQALDNAGVCAAFGYATRVANGSLASAARLADIRMYNDKLGLAYAAHPDRP